MTLLARAPFLLVLSGLVVMLALSERIVAWMMPPVALLVAFALMPASFRVKRRGENRIAVLTLFVLFLFSSWIAYAVTRRLPVPPSVETIGTVVEVRPWGRFYAVAVKTANGGFILKLPFAEVTEGMRIRLAGQTAPFKDVASDSGFREDRFWYARGMTARLTRVRFAALPGPTWNIHGWRHRLYRALVLHMPRVTGATLNAAWTGKRDAELNERHRRWGTSHILAVSGFHVGIVMLTASRLFRRGKSRVLGMSLLLWLYVLLTGAPASAVRAGIMFQTVLLGELAGRPGSAVSSVSLAAALLLLRSPFLFWDIGWRLSVTAALIIAGILEQSAPDFLGVFGILAKRGRWALIGPSVWLATLPQVSWTFGGVPFAGVFINLIAPPFFSFALSLSSAVAALRLAGVPGTGFLLELIEGTFLLWSAAADWTASVISRQVEWHPFTAYCCAGFFIALLSRALRVPWRNAVLLVPLGSLASFFLFAG